MNNKPKLSNRPHKVNWHNCNEVKAYARWLGVGNSVVWLKGKKSFSIIKTDNEKTYNNLTVIHRT